MPCIKPKSHSPVNGQSFLDEDSNQPASKGPFRFKMGLVARCGLAAVLHCEKGFVFVAAEHAAGDEVE
jgi:hypothetical protein